MTLSESFVLRGPQFPCLQSEGGRQEFLGSISEGLQVKYQFLAHVCIAHAYFMESVEALHSFCLVLEGASEAQIAHDNSPGQPLRAADSWPVWDSDDNVIPKPQEASPTEPGALLLG